MKGFRATALAVVTLVCAPVQVGAQPINSFEEDVNAAIDDGIQWFRDQGTLTGTGTSVGFALLTLIEQANVDQGGGYVDLDAANQALARAAANTLANHGTYAGRGGMYAYTDGQALMALGLYARTGGPDPAGTTVRQAIDRMADRVIAGQSVGNANSGYWGYTGPGADSSTTQYAAAGLAAARGFYIGAGDPGGRIPQLTTALERTGDGYAANAVAAAGGILTDCGSQGCAGHGYARTGYAPSYQQTSSGMWAMALGGRGLNDNAVQRNLRWLYNMYNPESSEAARNNWSQAYYYYLWSSSKSYRLMDSSLVIPAAGNIGTADLGTLAANGARLERRNPLNDSRAAPRGAGGPGYYADAPAGWYYDYAYRLMNLQNVTGQFPNPQGTWQAEVDNGYALLVL